VKPGSASSMEQGAAASAGAPSAQPCFHQCATYPLQVPLAREDGQFLAPALNCSWPNG